LGDSIVQVLCPGTKVVVKEFNHGAGVIIDTILRMIDEELRVVYSVQLYNGGKGELEEKELDPQPGMVVLLVDYQ
jgi:hypothetical protein